MRSTQISISVLAALMLSVVLFAATAARAAAPGGGELAFTVLREGDDIGSHVLSFEKSADQLVVKIRTDIKVKVLFVTAYFFEHEGREVWRNGQLVTLNSTTDDDGTKHSLAVNAINAVTADGGELAVVGDGQTSKAPSKIIPASLWHEGILAGGAILNTLQGKQMNVTVEKAGREDVMVAGQKVSAQHYIIAGDLSRELWFDDNQVLVMVRFKGSDDSKIEYVLR